MKIILILFLSILTLDLYSQENYSVCKVDSTSQRVFVFSSRQYIANLPHAKTVIGEIESKYQLFMDLNISFFDNKEDCGYQIESIEIDQDSLVDIKANNVQEHWFAEYSRKSGKIEYFKTDGSLSVKQSYYLRKE